MRHAQLRAFHNVALTGGFSRAAEALGLSQPAISDQVRSLEAAYDTRLFRREHRQVQLTEDGQRLLEITRRLFDAESAAREMLTERRTERTGTLRIFADSPHHILHLLGRFRLEHPKIAVQVRSGNSTQILAALSGYEADIGIVGELPVDRSLEVIPLGDAPIVAFARRGGPLDGRESIDLAQLLRLPLVLREEGSRTRAKLEHAAGCKLPPGIEAEGREAVREIVAAGGGVGVVSEAELAPDVRLTKARIIRPDILMSEAIVCLAERANNRVIRAFLALTKAETAGMATIP